MAPALSVRLIRLRPYIKVRSSTERGRASEATAQRPSGFPGVSALILTEVAMMQSYHVVGRWIAVIAVCAFLGVLAGCARLGGAAGEGSSSPPLDSANYVFPPPDLQVYD
jgi:hypothetical protein